MAHIVKRKNKRGDTVYLVQIFLGKDENGKRKFLNRTIHGTKKDALRFAKQAEIERDRGTLITDRHTVGELLDDLLTDYEINGKNHAWAKRVVEKHLRPRFGQLPPEKVTTAVLRRYVAERKEQGAAPGTINLSLALLKRAFNLGHRSNKVAKVPYFPMLRVDNVREGFFERDEFERLLAQLPDEIRPVVAFAYYTGCRKGEILSLRWDQFDGDVFRLRRSQTKNRHPRTIPLVPQLLEIIRMQKAFRDRYWPDCPWVFFRHASGERIRDFRSAWEHACKRAGLWDEERQKPTKLFHDLRRTGVRNLVRSGVPERVAMEISGHKTRSVFDRYNIVSEQDVREAARRLGEYEQRRGKAESQTIVKHQPSTPQIQ